MVLKVKPKVGINLLKNNFYDLCIKVNGGVKTTPINFEGKDILLKKYLIPLYMV